MNSFDLSLAMPSKAQGDMMASPKYDTKPDPKTNEPVKQTVTEDGVTINKDKAPSIILGGPLGYKYTKLLDADLSLENMAAVAAAAQEASEGIPDMIPGIPGYVAMSATGPIVEDDTDAGFIYVVGADTLESNAVGEISQDFIDKRLKNPKRSLGIAMITEGKPTASLEALVKILKPLDVAITTMESGLCSMIAVMKGD